MEREFHRWLAKQMKPHPNVLLGVGDDAALLDLKRGKLVVTTDTVADGTHFLSYQHELIEIGHKALAVNLSDIAAMGATPVAAVLHFMLPNDFELAQAQDLYHGMNRLAVKHGVAIVGGDTNLWSGPLVIGATVMGTIEDLASAWRLDTARPGDAIFVSGEFGGSLAGHHLTFEPEVELAIRLASLGCVNAATDASDSLGSDLAAMANASGCGALLDLDCIPVSAQARKQAIENLGPDADQDLVDQLSLKRALEDGEDFGLILAVPSDMIDQMLADQSVSERLTRIGTFTDERGLWANQREGRPTKIKVMGYDHGSI